MAVAFAALCACRGAGPGVSPLPESGARFARANAAAAGVPSFAAIGPTQMSDGLPASGKVNAYAIDPTNASVIYVASGRGTGLETYSTAGVYRSTDGGMSWRPIDTGLVDPSGAISSAVNALWLDPAHPLTLLAASEYDGIFRTVNGGATWTNVYRTSQATQFAALSGTVYASTASGLLASSDDGATWKVQLAGTPARHPTAFGLATSGNVTGFYAGMSDGSIYAFAKTKWAKVGQLPYDAHTGTDGSTPQVHQMTVDPFAPKTVYASSNDGSWDQDLHASTDGGRSWSYVLKKRYGSLGLGTQAIAFSVVHPHRIFLGTDGGFFYFTGDGNPNPPVYKAANLSVIDVRNVWTVPNGSDDECWVASDQGLTDEKACSLNSRYQNDNVVTKTLNVGLARRFAITPNGQTIVVSLQDFDSSITFDGGKTWHTKNSLYEDGFNELAPGSATKCYAYDEAVGFAYSSNGCASYDFTGYYSNIYPSRLMTTPVAFDPLHPGRIYVAAGPIVGFNHAKTGVYVTTTNGQSFAQVNWPFVQPGMLLFDAKNGKHVLGGDLHGGKSSISVSFDGGATWKVSTGVPATGFWYAATISPVDSNLVLATSMDASNNIFVLRSTDGGKTFTKAATVTNAVPIRGRIDLDRPVKAYGAQSESPDADEAAPPAPRQAFVYSPAREIRFNQEAKAAPDVVVTTLHGAYLSTDSGTTWQRLDNALIAHSFWGIRWNKGYLYLGSDGQGIVRSTRPLQ